MQKYLNNVQNVNSDGVLSPAIGASVTVNTLAGALATIYSDNGITPITNPIFTDGFGEFGFYAADGRYNLSINYKGQITLVNDILLEDPADGSAALAASSGSSLIGFIQAGTGAVARTLQSKGRENISVTDYGADITGVASAVTAFQNTINSTPDGGVNIITVPAGTYKGDMTTLTYGDRRIIWDEKGLANYPDGFPAQTRKTERQQPATLFKGSVNASRHLRQFSTRRSSAGAGSDVSATLAAGAITGFTVNLGGANYVAPRAIIVGDGTGASATVTLTAGAVSSLAVTAGGAGYTVATVYIIDGPIVVLVGDSISTENPSPSNPTETLYHTLCQEIQNQNPKTTITFFNRGVGAQTWTTFNNVATSNFPSWYSNTSKLWMDYVKELQPDLVVCAFGMNDKQDFVPAQMTTCVTSLITFATRPDVVLATNLVPSAITGDPNLSSSASQIGRDFVAGYMRGYALTNSYGLIDFNRQFRLVRDGFDVRESALKAVTVAGLQTLPYTYTDTCMDFSLGATFPAIAAGFWTSLKIDARITPIGSNVVTFARVEDNAGKMKISVIEQNPNTLAELVQTSLTSTLTTPTTGDVVVYVAVTDQRLQVKVNTIVVFDQTIARCGGLFSPSIAATGKSATIDLCVGQNTQFNSRLNDYELFGYGSSNAFKGNAQNHPTSLAVKHVFSPVIKNTDFVRFQLSQGSATFSVVNNFGLNEPDPVGLLHITKAAYTSTITPASNANILVLEDATAAGMSILASSAGSCRINMGDEGSSTQSIISYNHTTDLFAINLAGTNQMQISSATGGMILGAPTGGYKGTGTLNATAVYDDNVLLTCYVVEAWLDGKVTSDFWDNQVENLYIPAEYEEQEIGVLDLQGNAMTKTVMVKKEVNEVREHKPAQGFAQVHHKRLDIDSYYAHVKKHRKLPAFPDPEQWAESGGLSTGDLLQRIWETVEVQAVHIYELNEQIKNLQNNKE